MIKVGTHANIYHLDEITAIALIKFLDDVEIIRSRNEVVLKEAEMLVDVGGEYDPEKSLYDHHQFKYDEYNYGVSSAGLVWRDMRNFFYSQYDDLTDLEDFIKYVDARDTRVGYDSSNVYDVIGEAITATNHIDPRSKEQDYRFNIMVDIITSIIKALASKNIKVYTSSVKNLELLAESYNEEKKPLFVLRKKSAVELDNVIVSKFFPEWRAMSKELGKCFIMPGDEDGQYKIMIDTSKYKIMIVKDEVFVHVNGFIAVVEPKETSDVIGIALTNGDLFEVAISKIEEVFRNYDAV